MRLFGVEIKWTVPNLLSVLRILLIPVFAWLYLTGGEDQNRQYWAFAVLLLSGITDCVDGFIARKYNQISDFGKILDPVADKLTQLAVIICLATRYRELITLMVIVLGKELFQVIGGILLLRRGDRVRGAKWFGKLSTVVFYGSMALIVLYRDMPQPLLIALIIVVSITMLAAFIGYLLTFLGAKKTLNN